MALHQLCPPDEPFYVCMEGQFIVSHENVLRHELQLYKTLLGYLTVPADHFIHQELMELATAHGDDGLIAHMNNSR